MEGLIAQAVSSNSLFQELGLAWDGCRPGTSSNPHKQQVEWKGPSMPMENDRQNHPVLPSLVLSILCIVTMSPELWEETPLCE